MKTTDKINFLNKDCKTNWEIRFHGDYVDINYPDSPVTPDYEDYKSLNIALDEVINDLLAQKEDRKECKHELGDKEEHDNLGTYHIAGDTCVKCGKHIMNWDKPTPSPLEIEEIEEIKADGLSEYISHLSFAKAINSLISNQKKLYQYIKEKK